MTAVVAFRLCAAACVASAALLLAACTGEPEGARPPQAVAASAGSDTSASVSEARSRKRSAPPKVEPVEHRGVRYAVVRGAKGRGLPQNGGYIEATELASGRSLWLVKVYEVVYDRDIEDDKRDVYISRLRLDSARSRLLIENERDERFAVELDGSKVHKLPR
ncbi:MAG: hypothetical protein ACREUX_19045 [Burkholderiales bacterium]